MKKVIILTLSLLMSANISASSKKREIRKLTKREKVFKKKFLYSLVERKGYPGNKAWDKFLTMSIEAQDKEVLKYLMSVPIFEGVKNVQYSKDLFSVFRAAPNFYMKTALSLYKKNMDCVVYQFAREPEVIYKGDLKNLMSSFKSKNLVNYRERVNEYWESKKKVLNLHGCRKNKLDYYSSKAKPLQKKQKKK
ncbi:MAG: hypothetical protein GY909_04470 [Oligoflexia bacterium]|nr:hypothetical protein [Oligoflexia bacterium]